MRIRFAAVFRVGGCKRTINRIFVWRPVTGKANYIPFFRLAALLVAALLKAFGLARDLLPLPVQETGLDGYNPRAISSNREPLENREE